MQKKLITLLLYMYIAALGISQDLGHTPPITNEQCGAHALHEWKQEQSSGTISDQEFEEWIAQKIRNLNMITRNQNTIITIPVVVHVIHQGEDIGTFPNITDSQILSQINVLNQDFRRLENSNGYNEHPDGADIEIEFCLSVVTPQGELSTGINRYQHNESSWSLNQFDEQVKPTTIWNPEKYFNIWICNLLPPLKGYAQFPCTPSINGLDEDQEASTDGIVIDAKYFGNIEEDDGTFILDETDNLGKTATHEAGHFFGLMHIWGQGGCESTDYCNDTPTKSTFNTGCPSDNTTSCSSADMTENYMDYTSDACSNIFTKDQKTRIHAVLANSPRRKDLPTTTICTTPPSFVYSGYIIDQNTNQVIPNAHIFFDGVFNIRATTNSLGKFYIPTFYEGHYDIYAGQWGYLPKKINHYMIKSNTSQISVYLNKGYEDSFIFDYEWEVSGSADNGTWVRSIPLGSNYNDLLFDPDHDVTEDFGNYCFLTGNGGGLAGDSDVDNGSTTLLSPIFNANLYTNPKLSFYRWFANESIQTVPADDLLEIYLSNGNDEILLKTINANNEDLCQWVKEEFIIAEHITVTSDMRLNIKVSDQETSSHGHLVDAAIDLFKIEEQSAITAVNNLAHETKLSLTPNPTNGIVHINIGEFNPSTDQIEIFNTLGKKIYGLKIQNSKYSIDLSPQPKGIFFVTYSNKENSFTKKIMLL